MPRGRPKGSGKKETPTKNERPELETKEELMKYIARTESELPFVEEVWELAVAKAEENKLLNPPVDTVTTTDSNGNTTTKRVPRGSKPTNPVSVYWSYMNLPQYKKRAQEILYHETAAEDDKDVEEIMEVYFDDDSGGYNEIVEWIEMFPLIKERNYLKQRYAHYYDNYEINDGADRVMLHSILSLEIELYRINIKRAKGQAIDIAREEKLRKMLRESLEAQKWTKKQRSATDEMAQNKFSIWMDKQTKNGKFTPEHHEIPKDEIDMLIEIIPKAVAKMLD